MKRLLPALVALILSPALCQAAAQRPQLAIQRGHSQPVVAVAFSRDGLVLATAGEDIRLWDVKSGALTGILPSADPLSAVAFSPTDPYSLVSASHDGWISWWDTRSEQMMRQVKLPGVVRNLECRFSGDGTMLAVASGALAFSRDGHRIAALAGSTLRLFDAAAATPLAVLDAGRPGPLDRWAIALWNVDTRQVIQRLWHTALIRSLAFSPDSATLASGSDDQTLRTWNVADGSQKLLLLHPEHLTAVAFSADGNYLASGCDDSTVRLWDAASGRQLRQLGGEEGYTEITAISFSPTAPLLASARRDHRVQIWNTGDGVPQHTLSGELSFITDVALAPDGSRMATAEYTHFANDHASGPMKTWDPRTGQLLRAVPGMAPLAFSPDSISLAAAGMDHTVDLWDARTGTFRQRLTGHKTRVAGLAFLDDRQLVSAGGALTSTIKVWDIAAGHASRFWQGGDIVNIVVGKAGSTLFSLQQSGNVAVWGSQDGSLRMLLKGLSLGLRALAYAPATNLVAAGDYQGKLLVWDAATGFQKSQLLGAQGHVAAVAFSPDGRSVAGGGQDKTVRIWDAATGRLQQTMTGHSDTVDSLAYEPDGRILVSAGRDGTIRFWKTSNGHLLATIVSLGDQAAGKPLIAFAKDFESKALIAYSKTPEDPDEYIVVTPQGYYSGSAQAERYVRFRVGSQMYPVESFQKQFYRPDLVRRALAGEELAEGEAPKASYPPVAAFVSPRSGDTVSGNTAAVVIETAGEADVDKVDVFVNGARLDSKAIIAYSKALIAYSKSLTIDSKPLIAFAKPLDPAYRTTRRFTATIPLPPGSREVTVQAIAYDHNGLESAREEIVLQHQGNAAETQGRLLALCVGVSHYADTSLNLHYAGRDAADLADALAKVPVGGGGMYREAKVTTLQDEKATSPGVLAALDDMIANVKASDTVLLMLSGHGWRSDQGNFYFATTEVDRRDVTHTCLPWRDMVARLARLSEKSRRVVVLLDACHSGSAATNEDLVTDLVHGKTGVLVLASSKGSELSVELPSQGHGAFTAALLEAIQGQAGATGEHTLSTLDLLSYVARRVKVLTENQQHPEVPYLQDFETDSVIMPVGG